MSLVDRIKKLYRLLICCGEKLQSPLLLAMRLYWGYNFFVGGKGKLENFDKTLGFFTDLGLPFPTLNVILASCTECFGGLLLMVGLGTRLVSLPLLFTMAVAYWTADREALNAIISDPDKFVSATPFLFALTCFVVLAFGPGKLSIDHLLKRKFEPKPVDLPV